MDGQRVHDTETMEQLEGIPDRLIVVGAGVIGLEYACMAAALGRVVTVIDQRAALLDFVDREIVERLLVALFTEMYGYPLTIYLLSGWLGLRFPGVDFLSHDAGHLLEVMFGWRANPHFGPFH